MKAEHLKSLLDRIIELCGDEMREFQARQNIHHAVYDWDEEMREISSRSVAAIFRWALDNGDLKLAKYIGNQVPKKRASQIPVPPLPRPHNEGFFDYCIGRLVLAEFLPRQAEILSKMPDLDPAEVSSFYADIAERTGLSIDEKNDPDGIFGPE